jgi:putative AlgH/UPF0301 family transcriptional regulator
VHLLGGQSNLKSVSVIHGTDYQRLTVVIDGQLAMTSSVEIFRDIANGQGPIDAWWRSAMPAGHRASSGRVGQRFWFTTPADRSLVFEADRDKVWDEAMKRPGTFEREVSAQVGRVDQSAPK